MKKLSIFFPIILIVVGCILCFAACDSGDSDNNSQFEEQTEAHVCAFGEWKKLKAPTCAENGERERVCECGNKETESIEKLEHTEVIDEAVAPTCTEPGLTEGKHCSICDEILVKQESVAADHVWAEEYSWDDNAHWYACTLCKEIANTDLHTVDEEGYCSVCKHVVVGTEGVLYYPSTDGTYMEAIGYTGDSKKVIIPEIYDGLPVTHISNNAFHGKNITSVVIPNGVTNIGSYAFYGCSDLESVKIGNSVTSIGDWVFYNCTSLTDVTIPAGATSIGSYAFYGCSSIKSITIPEGVKSIESYVFYGCSGLESITIPDGVTSIGSYAFYDCSGLTAVNYKGSEEAWKEISIGGGNEALENATVSYNYVP